MSTPDGNGLAEADDLAVVGGEVGLGALGRLGRGARRVRRWVCSVTSSAAFDASSRFGESSRNQ